MNSVTSRRLLLVAGAALIAPQARAADEYLYPDFDRPSDWTRNFRVGMQIGLNIKAKFTTTGSFSVGNSGAGPNGYTFDNGYLLKDISGSADNTWNWGYETANQYDAGAQVVRFTSTSGYDVGNAPSTTINDQPYVGFDMGYGWSFARWGEARIGAELGVGILPINISDRRTLNATLSSQDFSIPVGTLVVPEAPYHGSFEGPGITVPATPDAAEPSTPGGQVAGSRTLDVTLYSLRLGPTVSWQLSPKLGVGLSAGGAFGIVSGDYRFSERPVGSTGAFNTGSFGKTDPVFGAYASGIATYRIEEHGDLYLGVQFMSMRDSTFRQGGREAKLGLGSAFYITAGVNWPF